MKPISIALIGNPNSGKTAVFNQLTGLNQKVSNYPGITVEKKIGMGTFSDGRPFRILDLPGTYSLVPDSLDEQIVSEQTLNWSLDLDRPDVIVAVVDASNLRRNLLLVTQISDLGIPVILALNMADRVHHDISDDMLTGLENGLGLWKAIPLVAIKGKGFKELKAELQSVGEKTAVRLPVYAGLDKEAFHPLETWLTSELGFPRDWCRAQALRLVCKSGYSDLVRAQLEKIGHSAVENWTEFMSIRDSIRSQTPNWRSLPAGDAGKRYAHIDAVLTKIKWGSDDPLNRRSRSERADAWLTHPVLGPLIFVLLLVFIFQAIFSWAVVPMDWISQAMDWLNAGLHRGLPPGPLRDLLTDGILAGVGSIVVFLPQILILVFFLTLLEDSGYMARVAFMLDRFMSRMGLHGRSVLPLMSGYACAIPGIMATRTIDSWKERLITILILPLMSCSARLPVYALMIGAFIPNQKIGGIFGLQGLTLVSMYFLGTITALIMAKVFSRLIRKEKTSSFIMEMPPYRIPLMRSVGNQVILRGKLFLKNAGKIIMAVSIILWFLASYPKVDSGSGPVNNIERSFAGTLGHVIEPVIRPLGFDWKIGVGLVTSFAAREVLVSTLATMYNVADEQDDVLDLRTALRMDTDPATGKPRYSVLTALSLMVFFVFAAQCMATFAIVRHETNSWKWPLFMVTYLTVLAYLASLVVYQGGLRLGWG
ncbi:MAG: ferrous iron transport protein B [FCB group bacterium]|nr:ferrous iron transport protein B [FCB group bacterium]